MHIIFAGCNCASVFQLWCAAGVNLSGGKTRDGGSIVGASVFYSDVPGPESPKKKIGSQSSLDKLDQELKVQTQVLLVSVQLLSSHPMRTLGGKDNHMKNE